MINSKIAQNILQYSKTFSCGLAGLDIDDANTEDIESNNTIVLTINNIPYPSTADAAYVIDTELPYAAWAATATYTAMGILSEVTNRIGHHYACILGHVATAADEPGYGANWETYWRKLDRWPTMAYGDVVANGTTKYYLVCALSVAGAQVLRMFNAYNPDTLAIQIPAFDPFRYCPVGMVSIANASGSDFIVGTTGLDTGSVTDTYYDFTGPVFPAAECLDRN